jgi:hypothetical protein
VRENFECLYRLAIRRQEDPRERTFGNLVQHLVSGLRFNSKGLTRQFHHVVFRILRLGRRV